MGRITRVSHVYYETADRPILHCEHRSNRPIAGDGQHYERDLLADGQWQLIDWGWVDSPSLVVITNMNKSPIKPTDPTPLIQVRFMTNEESGNPHGRMIDPHLSLSSRESLEVCPFEGSLLWVRGNLSSQISFKVIAIP